MKLSSEFLVPAEPERVFPLFFDPDTMRSCIPGCEELVRVDESSYRGRLLNEIAHVKFNAGFTATVSSIDAPREVRAVLKGEDRRLGSSIKIDAMLTVRPEGDGSMVGYAMEMALWGKLGRIGESIVRRRSIEVERDFVEAFARACTATTTVPPMPAIVPVPPVVTAPAAGSAEPAPAPREAPGRADDTLGEASPAASSTVGRAGAAQGAAGPPPPTRDQSKTWWRRIVDTLLRRGRKGS